MFLRQPVFYNSRSGLLERHKSAVAVKPAAQMNSSAEEPRDWRTAPASTEATGIMPWEPMLMMLLTLLSLSRSTMRIMAVLTGILIQDTRKPIARQPRQNTIRKTFREEFRETPWPTSRK